MDKGDFADRGGGVGGVDRQIIFQQDWQKKWIFRDPEGLHASRAKGLISLGTD